MPAKKTASKRKVILSSDSPSVKEAFAVPKRVKSADDEDKVKIEKELRTKMEEKEKSSLKSDEESKVPTLKSKSEVEGEDKKSESASSTSDKYDKEEFKTASNGQEWNLKIVSWNMNGIRAWLDHGGIDYLKAEDPDIFCCQETKCDKSKIPSQAVLSNYHTYWLSGDTQGYSGVGLMSKIKPIKVTYGINNEKHDNEGRVIVAEYEKFILVNSYIPNSGRGLTRLSYRMEWEDEFRKFLSQLESQKPIIWCGDLNVAHNKIDIKNPQSNSKSAGFTVEERDCFTKILSDGYFDSFRHLYPTSTGAFTYWSYFRNARQLNIGWRLDYFILSEKLKSNLVDNMMRTKVTGSDHCPIALFLKI